jgi:hypothetical protein
MKTFVIHILNPYFSATRIELGLSPDHKALWQIDVWSVHRSKEFRAWMKKNYENIIVDFVPGGCTGVAQPCDVGIQRPFKQSLKRSYHEAVVNEVLECMAKNKPVAIDKGIKKIRDRAPTWLWNAYKTINNPELVKKVRNKQSIPN